MKNIKLFEEYFWGNVAAGILPICTETKRILVGFRSKHVHMGECWGTIGGKLDIESENIDIIKSEALREFEEECEFYGKMKLYNAYVYVNKESDFRYYNFIGEVKEEFKPVLNWENTEIKWFTYDELLKLKNKHLGLIELLNNSKDLINKVLNT